MQLQSVTSSRDFLRLRDEISSYNAKEERRRTGRYVAGGAALAIILIALYHVFGRGTSTITGICIPAIIMATYIIWVLYAAHKDQIRAMRLESAMNLTAITPRSNIPKVKKSTATVNTPKNPVDVI